MRDAQISSFHKPRGYLISAVPGFEGECKPVWLNRNEFDRRMNGGVTGFFRLTKRVWWWPFAIRTGKEFHGVVVAYGVFSTELK